MGLPLIFSYSVQDLAPPPVTIYGHHHKFSYLSSISPVLESHKKARVKNVFLGFPCVISVILTREYENVINRMLNATRVAIKYRLFTDYRANKAHLLPIDNVNK